MQSGIKEACVTFPSSGFLIEQLRNSAAGLKALRAAFDATMKDPDFRAEVTKAKAEFHPLPGADLQKLIEATAQTPPEIIARMKGLLQAAK